MKKLIFVFLALSGFFAQSQTDPLITSWWINTSGIMVQGVLAGVQSVHYTNDYVYVSTSGIPAYYEPGQSVNAASAQNWVLRFPRNPQPQTGNLHNTQGPIACLIDGSEAFDPGDAMSYQNQGNWNRIAYYFEVNDFDSTNGHSTPDNIYHHHVDPIVLHNFSSTTHSPLIGYAFDGYPIYGPFGFVNTNGSGGVKRMTSSYQLRNISSRTTLPNGTSATGPAIGGMYPLGCFKEDYEYISGSGDLDEHNGRFTVTPEYPNGTYAYFATVDALLNPQYPYFIGPTYYGVVDNSNLGPNGGNNTIPSNATEYNPLSATLDINKAELKLIATGNYLKLENNMGELTEVILFNGNGKIVRKEKITASTTELNISDLPPALYIAEAVYNQAEVKVLKFIKE